MPDVQFSIPFREPNRPEQGRDQPGRPCRKGQPAEDGMTDAECRGIHLALLDTMERELRQWHRLDEEERGEWLDWILLPIPWGGAYREPSAGLLARIRALGAGAAANPFQRKIRAEKRSEIQNLLEDAGCLVPGSFAACCLAAGVDPEIMQSSLRHQLAGMMPADCSVA